jgi:hypothetical protein
MNSRMPDQDDIQERLKTAQEECRWLREENADLRAMLGINPSPPKEPVPQAVPNANPSSTTRSRVSTPEEKIWLFQNLFRGREDVFATRWEGKGGKSGYSPCRHHGLACHPSRDQKSERRLPAKPGCSSR